MVKDSIVNNPFWKEDAALLEEDGGEARVLTDIIRGCCGEKPQSQELLYKKYYGYAMSVALKYCCDREDAREVTNDSFMKVFRNIKKFDIHDPFKPWFRKIVVNTSIDKIRKNKKFQHHLDINEVQEACPVDIESDLSADQVYSLLKELPALHRCVFNMYEIDGYPHQEIAAMLGISESSSRTFLTRAKAKLRQLYRKYERDSK